MTEGVNLVRILHFTQLLCQPLVCTLMLNQHDLDSIQVLVVHVKKGFAFLKGKDSNKMKFLLLNNPTVWSVKRTQREHLF